MFNYRLSQKDDGVMHSDDDDVGHSLYRLVLPSEYIFSNWSRTLYIYHRLAGLNGKSHDPTWHIVCLMGYLYVWFNYPQYTHIYDRKNAHKSHIEVNHPGTTKRRSDLQKQYIPDQSRMQRNPAHRPLASAETFAK